MHRSLAPLLALVAGLSLASSALGGPITAISTSSSDLSSPGNSYTATATSGGSLTGSQTFNFNSGGSPDNLTLGGLTHGGSGFDVAGIASRIVFRRNDNAAVTGNRQILWYQHVGFSSNTFSVNPSRVNNMEAALLSSIINRGTDNLFTNSGGNNESNIERLDYIYDFGIAPTTAAQLGVGFALLERGGNDAFGIAAITGLDASGNPTSYGSLVSIASSAWGSGLVSGGVDTVVVRGPDTSTTYGASANVTSQNLHGVLVTLSDLGVSVGDTIYGYSLFSDEVLATDDLVDWTTFATTGGSGLDLAAGGLAFKPELVSIAGMFATPEPGTWALFGLGLLSLAGLSRRRRDARRASTAA